MLTIEFDDPVLSDPCACCGRQTTALTRFVNLDGEGYAVYYARYTDNHPDGIVTAFVILGKWGDDAVPLDRVGFGLNLVLRDDGYGVIVVDATETPWRDSRQAGCKLTRENALKHPRLDEVYHITSHIFREDKPIIDYLNAQKRNDRQEKRPAH